MVSLRLIVLVALSTNVLGVANAFGQHQAWEEVIFKPCKRDWSSFGLPLTMRG